jgi:GTP-binding protein HflX
MLMRQEGGIGVRGPGETKLEVDRRRITDRITHIKNEIKQVRVHREMLRKKRRREEIAYVALVGYTSAGKTSLLNALTGAGKTTNASYFTTLDTVTRILQVGALDRVLIADTVGFVHDLPEKLVEAFMATLEELRDADLLLHVVDAANPHYNKMQHAVTQLLERLDLKDKPLLYVYNKVDLLDSEQLATRAAQHTRNSIFVSASTGEGLEDLLTEIGNRLNTARVVEVTIPYGNTAALNYLYKHARIHDTRSADDGSLIFEVTMTPETLGALEKLNKSSTAS